MSIARSLIPELDEIVRHDDPRRRAEAARRITELFLQGAATFRADHVDLFDGVLIDLVPHAELAARADLAERLSLLANAPRALVGQLARDVLGRAATADGKATIGCHSGARQRELRCAIAHRRISRFPDVRSHIWGSMLCIAPE